MVRIGFICEGETEKIIVESEEFKALLSSFNLELTGAIDATGNGNLLPKNIEPFHLSLIDSGAKHVLILTDLEEEPCITEVKQRIKNAFNHPIVVSVRAIEAWYLADSTTLSSAFKKGYFFQFPEQRNNVPIEILRQEFIAHTGNGIGKSKPKFARKMLNLGFSVTNAAKHENCSSAKYFLSKLKEISQS